MRLVSSGISSEYENTFINIQFKILVKIWDFFE